MYFFISTETEKKPPVIVRLEIDSDVFPFIKDPDSTDLFIKITIVFLRNLATLFTYICTLIARDFGPKIVVEMYMVLAKDIQQLTSAYGKSQEITEIVDSAKAQIDADSAPIDVGAFKDFLENMDLNDLEE